jgi:hypothetical protein
MVAARAVTVEQASAMPKVDLAMKLMDFYIKYPLPSKESAAWMPWNYCLLSKRFPFLPEIC